jgi:hypothetical protein
VHCLVVADVVCWLFKQLAGYASMHIAGDHVHRQHLFRCRKTAVGGGVRHIGVFCNMIDLWLAVFILVGGAVSGVGLCVSLCCMYRAADNIADTYRNRRC